MKRLLEIMAGSIRHDSLRSEAQVRQSIVVPILRGLGWAETNSVEFKTEFKIPNGKGTVDYALCGKHEKPLIFIEAKRPGKVDDKGKEQLLKYAADQQVPFLILTDGRIWYFYLGKTKGVTIDQYFYCMDFANDKENRKYAKFFKKYFYKDAIISGASLKEAEQYYQSNKEKARKEIPKVWRALLKPSHVTLRNVLVREVERKCGIKPELNDVKDFIQKCLSGDRVQITGFIFDENRKEFDSGIITLAGVLKEFHNRDPEFMSRFAPQVKGSKWRLVAQSREGLCDDSSLSKKRAYDMENGWWLKKKISKENIRKYIKIACEVAGITFGSQLTLIEDRKHKER